MKIQTKVINYSNLDRYGNPQVLSGSTVITKIISKLGYLHGSKFLKRAQDNNTDIKITPVIVIDDKIISSYYEQVSK